MQIIDSLLEGIQRPAAFVHGKKHECPSVPGCSAPPVWCGCLLKNHWAPVLSRAWWRVVRNLDKERLWQISICFGVIPSQAYLLHPVLWGQSGRKGEKNRKPKLEVHKNLGSLSYFEVRKGCGQPPWPSFTGAFIIQAFLGSEMHVRSFQNCWISEPLDLLFLYLKILL